MLLQRRTGHPHRPFRSGLLKNMGEKTRELERETSGGEKRKKFAFPLRLYIDTFFQKRT
jgi:hypothetical protein